MLTPWAVARAMVATYPSTAWNIQQALCVMALSSASDLEWIGNSVYRSVEDDDADREAKFSAILSNAGYTDADALEDGAEVAAAFGRLDFLNQQKDPRVRPPPKARFCLALSVPDDARLDWLAAILHGLMLTNMTRAVGYPQGWRRSNPHLEESFSFAENQLTLLLGTLRTRAEKALLLYPFVTPDFIASGDTYWESHYDAG